MDKKKTVRLDLEALLLLGKYNVSGLSELIGGKNDPYDQHGLDQSEGPQQSPKQPDFPSEG